MVGWGGGEGGDYRSYPEGGEMEELKLRAWQRIQKPDQTFFVPWTGSLLMDSVAFVCCDVPQCVHLTLFCGVGVVL
jgi:hypothetical protein